MISFPGFVLTIFGYQPRVRSLHLEPTVERWAQHYANRPLREGPQFISNEPLVVVLSNLVAIQCVRSARQSERNFDAVQTALCHAAEFAWQNAPTCGAFYPGFQRHFLPVGMLFGKSNYFPGFVGGICRAPTTKHGNSRECDNLERFKIKSVIRQTAHASWLGRLIRSPAPR
jgi:hypothetical protein